MHGNGPSADLRAHDAMTCGLDDVRVFPARTAPAAGASLRAEDFAGRFAAQFAGAAAALKADLAAAGASPASILRVEIAVVNGNPGAYDALQGAFLDAFATVPRPARCVSAVRDLPGGALVALGAIAATGAPPIDWRPSAVIAEDGPAPCAPFPHARTYREGIWATAQVGSDPRTGSLAPVAGGAEPQCDFAVDNLKRILRAAGGDEGSIVHCRLQVVDGLRCGGAQGARRRCRLAGHAPARGCGSLHSDGAEGCLREGRCDCEAGMSVETGTGSQPSGPLGLGGKVAIVTGAAGGIGRAIALALAQDGAAVVVADRNEAGAAETVGLIQGRGGRALALGVDICDEASLAAMAERTIAWGGSIDLLAANAGMMVAGDVLSLTLEQWRLAFEVNATGSFLSARAVLPHMIERRSGAIVFTASTVGVVGRRGDAAYSASKGAVVALTRQMAADFAQYGIRVNAVAPGVIRTALVEGLIASRAKRMGLDADAVEEALLSRYPLQRFGAAEEVAQAVLYLGSDRAGWSTGIVLPVDGGLLAVR